MGYDLVGRKLVTKKNSEKNVFVISSEQGTFQNSDGYLASNNVPTDTLLWRKQCYMAIFMGIYTTGGTRGRVETTPACLAKMILNRGMVIIFFFQKKIISIAKCCLQGRDMGLYDQYIQQNLSKIPKSGMTFWIDL